MHDSRLIFMDILTRTCRNYELADSCMTTCNLNEIIIEKKNFEMLVFFFLLLFKVNHLLKVDDHSAKQAKSARPIQT